MNEAGAYERRVDDYYSELEDLLAWELADKDDEEFWRWIASRHGRGPILEVGCGAGRITRLLARGSAPVLAVDLSRDLLTRAETRVSTYSNVQLARADFRLLPTAWRFGLVVAADDPFSHMIEEWRRAESFQAVADRLEPAGALILDALWFAPDQRRAARGPGGLTKEHVSRSERGLLRVRENWHLEAETSRCRAAYEYWLEGELIRQVDFKGRFWTYTEVRQRCKSSGLAIRRCWGDYGRNRWSPETSDRLIVEAMRG